MADPPRTYVDAEFDGPYPVFTFGANEPATFSCSIDDGGYVPCSSPLRLTGLGVGEHSVAVMATDLDGNTDPTPARTSWVLQLR